MGYHSELAAEMDQYHEKWLNSRYENSRLKIRLEARDGHILWLREKLKDIAAMKDQKRASDFARETLLEGMGGRPDH